MFCFWSAVISIKWKKKSICVVLFNKYFLCILLFFYSLHFLNENYTIWERNSCGPHNLIVLLLRNSWSCMKANVMKENLKHFMGNKHCASWVNSTRKWVAWTSQVLCHRCCLVLWERQRHIEMDDPTLSSLHGEPRTSGRAQSAVHQQAPVPRWVQGPGKGATRCDHLQSNTHAASHNHTAWHERAAATF